MRRIEVTATTMGKASASPVTLSGGYRYRGDPQWVPGDPRYREAAPASQTAGGMERTARREKRIAEFAAALADLGEPDPWKAANATVVAAGVTVGVRRKTAMGYRTELRKRQPQGEVRDDG